MGFIKESFMSKVSNEIFNEMCRIKQERGVDISKEEYKELVDKVFTKWREKLNL
ncbi:MAG: hypothetical protein ACRCX2_31950 [Paraclostridium sp.]